MFKKLLTKIKGDVEIKPGFCALCGEALDYSWMVLAFAANMAAYKCRNCGVEICMNCAKTKRCPRCDGNVFDRTTERPQSTN
jgi:hypothetical protein